MREGIKIVPQKWYQKLFSFLYEVTFDFGKIGKGMHTFNVIILPWVNKIVKKSGGS